MAVRQKLKRFNLSEKVDAILAMPLRRLRVWNGRTCSGRRTNFVNSAVAAVTGDRRELLKALKKLTITQTQVADPY